MFFLTSIFFVSFFAAAGMLLFRHWQIQKGRVPTPFPSRVDLSYRFRAFAEAEKKVWDASKHWSMRAGTQILRSAVVGIDSVRIEMRKLIARMEEALMKKHAKDPQGAPSFFLKDIAEHKKKMRLKFRRNVPERNEIDKV